MKQVSVYQLIDVTSEIVSPGSLDAWSWARIRDVAVQLTELADQKVAEGLLSDFVERLRLDEVRGLSVHEVVNYAVLRRQMLRGEHSSIYTYNALKKLMDEVEDPKAKLKLIKEQVAAQKEKVAAQAPYDAAINVIERLYEQYAEIDEICKSNRSNTNEVIDGDAAMLDVDGGEDNDVENAEKAANDPELLRARL
jgi:hypothetical protein